jgi:hypothetical protein
MQSPRYGNALYTMLLSVLAYDHNITPAAARSHCPPYWLLVVVCILVDQNSSACALMCITKSGQRSSSRCLAYSSAVALMPLMTVFAYHENESDKCWHSTASTLL